MAETTTVTELQSQYDEANSKATYFLSQAQAIELSYEARQDEAVGIYDDKIKLLREQLEQLESARYTIRDTHPILSQLTADDREARRRYRIYLELASRYKNRLIIRKQEEAEAAFTANVTDAKSFQEYLNVCYPDMIAMNNGRTTEAGCYVTGAKARNSSWMTADYTHYVYAFDLNGKPLYRSRRDQSSSVHQAKLGPSIDWKLRNKAVEIVHDTRVWYKSYGRYQRKRDTESYNLMADTLQELVNQQETVNVET